MLVLNYICQCQSKSQTIIEYLHKKKTFHMCTGNFTQLIWRSTDQVGVGLASDGKGKFITVAFYKPPGNVTNPGYFQDNVKPAGR